MNQPNPIVETIRQYEEKNQRIQAMSEERKKTLYHEIEEARNVEAWLRDALSMAQAERDQWKATALELGEELKKVLACAHPHPVENPSMWLAWHNAGEALALSTEGKTNTHAEQVKALQQEIEILRQYGNKDCTAMADEALEEIRKEAKQ